MNFYFGQDEIKKYYAVDMLNELLKSEER